MLQSSKHILLHHIPLLHYTINKLFMEYILKTKSKNSWQLKKKNHQHYEESPKIGLLEHEPVSVFRFVLWCPQHTSKDLVNLTQNCHLWVHVIQKITELYLLAMQYRHFWQFRLPFEALEEHYLLNINIPENWEKSICLQQEITSCAPEIETYCWKYSG